MPLEDGTTISALDRSFPLPDDPVHQGDDHITLIKKVLKAQFPGANGQGFAVPITATEEEINNLDGLDFNILDGFKFIGSVFGNALTAPEGTILLFAQATVPAGWAQVTNASNCMLRHVTDDSGGTFAGEDSPIEFNWQHTHETSEHKLVNNELPSHSHAMFSGRADNNAPGVGVYQYTAGWWDNGSSGQNYTMKASPNNVAPTVGAVSLTGKNIPHNHGPTGQNGQIWKPRYLNVIKGRKKANLVPT